jgi:hypothetical protein
MCCKVVWGRSLLPSVTHFLKRESVTYVVCICVCQSKVYSVLYSGLHPGSVQCISSNNLLFSVFIFDLTIIVVRVLLFVSFLVSGTCL